MKVLQAARLVHMFLLYAGMLLILYGYGIAADRPEFPSGKEACEDCHSGPANQIRTEGHRHRIVPCVGCHLGHLPAVKGALQNCNRCHLKTRRAHFQLDNCRGCHKNPHTPLKISFTDIKGACGSCHAVEVAMLRDNRTRHSNLECATCHDVHRKIPQCTQCHQPHSAEMATVECRKCHKAHMPRPATYAGDIPSQDCGSCHRKAFNILAASGTKHTSLACAFCHPDKHKAVVDCRGCHGSPHPEGMMAKFPKCGQCHKIAHDLNNWPEVQAKHESRGLTEAKN